MPTDTLYGLVLAGGESRRMGQDKALLIRAGESQLAHAVRQLRSVTKQVFVSTRADQKHEAERSRFSQIVDRYENIGPVAGIMSAMEEYPGVNWLVVACDLPNIDESTLRFLIENCSVEKPFTAFRSSYDDLPEPLCAIYMSKSREIIQRFVDDGIVCPRKMLIRSDTQLLSQPVATSLDNINTPDDLEQSILKVAR